MRYLLSFVLGILFHCGHTQPSPCDQTIVGQVLDLKTGDPLPFATVTVLGTEKGAIADENGKFSLTDICELELDLELRFVGYKTTVHHHDFHHGESMIIYLASDDTPLESVVVEGKAYRELQSMSVQKKEVDKVALVNTSIGTLSEQLTGVSLLKTGSNISKPIIHGLHSNRVLVINDGVRHGYQVWGLEHSPEIDPSHVDQIEIVKGAGTVKYGPEALGGVILYNSKRPTFNQPLNGSVTSAYQTNGQAGSGQVSLGHGMDRFAWNVGGFGVYQGDLQAPDYNLSNTGKREYGVSFNTLYHQPKFDLQVSGSYFTQDIGILRASIVGNLTDLQNAIDRGEPSPTFDRTYSLQNPQQQTEHGLIKSVLSLYLGKHTFNVQYAAQRNIRVEFDVRRGELNDRPVIDLELWSHSVETEWIQPDRGRWSGSSGIQFFTQSSVNEPGSNPINFVPDYDVFNIGAFTIQSLRFDNMTIEAGARFDFQSLSVADTIRERTIYSNDVSFSNATFTLGIRKQMNEQLSVFSNIGSAWRPPNVSELYSFGYHFSRLQFGLWRYDLDPTITTPPDRVFDQSLRPVPSEKSYKWVSGLEWQSRELTAELIIYVNQINDYIFLRPYGITTGIAGTFPFFIYDQTNALFVGSDLDIRYKHSEFWTSEAKVSYVFAEELGSNQAFLEIPPFNVNYSIDYSRKGWTYGLNLNYTARQWNAPPVIEPIEFQNGEAEFTQDEIFDFMAAPDHYLLVGARVEYERNQWLVALRGDNLLNASYRIYTDRLRYFADAPGRNLSLSIGFEF